MRTTLTLDPDVAHRVRKEVQARGATFKEVINQGLRRGLRPAAPAKVAEPYTVQTLELNLRPGIDPNRLNQVLDELEVDLHARAPTKSSQRTQSSQRSRR